MRKIALIITGAVVLSGAAWAAPTVAASAYDHVCRPLQAPVSPCWHKNAAGTYDRSAWLRLVSPLVDEGYRREAIARHL